MKRIGFVDYNLENFHANTYLKLFRGPLANRGFEVVGGIGMREKASRIWAEANGVPYFKNLDALNEAVDFFVVLAPSNPERHLELCRWVFPFGKATYVDKTFAPDLKTAWQIFKLADRYRVPMQTSSALRYSNVQAYVQEVGKKQVQQMVAWGGGSSFGEYAIHPLEMVISCMGANVQKMMRRGTGAQSQLLLDFSGGRTAVVNVYIKARTPYAATVTTKKETAHILVQSGDIFLNTAISILDLFEKKKPSIDRKESLVIRRILDLAGQKSSVKRFVKV